MDFTSKRRQRPEEDATSGGDSGGRGGVAFPRAFAGVSAEDIAALREIARAGGGKHHVKARNVAVSVHRALRVEGLVELLDGVNGQVLAKLTARGLQALAAAPGVLAR